MSFQHYAVLVIWDYALPDGWRLNDKHNNWPTNPVIDGLPYRLVSKRFNDAAYALDLEAFKKTGQITDQAIELYGKLDKAQLDDIQLLHERCASLEAETVRRQSAVDKVRKYEVRHNAVTKVYEDGKYEFLITSTDELTTNLVVSVLNSETEELRQQLAELQDSAVNDAVENKMLKEQVELVAAAEDIVENLLDPGDTKLAEANKRIEELDKFVSDGLISHMNADNRNIELEAENAQMKAVIERVSKTISEDIAAAEDCKLHTDSGNISSQISSKIHALNKIHFLLNTLLDEAPATLIEQVTSEVTMTDAELDIFAKYEQRYEELSTWAIKHWPIGSRQSAFEYYVGLLERAKTPANRAAIEARRKELNLSE